MPPALSNATTQRLETHDNRILDLHTSMASLHTKVDNLFPLVAKVNQYLFTGNGVPPMTVRVDTLEKCMTAQNERGTFSKMFLRDAAIAVLGGVIAIVGSKIAT